MKPGSKRRRLAGIVAVASVTAACAASPAAARPPARLGQDTSPQVACSTLPIASASATGTSDQHARPDSLPPGVLAVAARSPGNAWAVGAPPGNARPEKAVVAHWNGAAWTTFSPRGLPRLSALYAVAAFPGGAWAVGESGLTQHGDGGGRPEHLLVRLTRTTMRRMPVPGPVDGELQDVAATSAANAWAVGYIGGVSGGPALILHWNGTAWKRAPLPPTVARDAGGAAGVAATSAKDVWLVSHWWIVHWTGQRWNIVSPHIGIRYALNDVAATSARNVWAVGDGLDKQVVVILHWNGRRWTCALSPKLSFPYLAAVSASSADDAWAVGDSGLETLALRWNGHTWKQVTTPQPNPGRNSLDDVAFIPHSGAVWAVDALYESDTPTVILRWNGTAWR